MSIDWKTEPSYRVYRALRRRYLAIQGLAAIQRIGKVDEATDITVAMRIAMRAADSGQEK